MGFSQQQWVRVRRACRSQPCRRCRYGWGRVWSTCWSALRGNRLTSQVDCEHARCARVLPLRAGFVRPDAIDQRPGLKLLRVKPIFGAEPKLPSRVSCICDFCPSHGGSVGRRTRCPKSSWCLKYDRYRNVTRYGTSVRRTGETVAFAPTRLRSRTIFVTDRNCHEIRRLLCFGRTSALRWQRSGFTKVLSFHSGQQSPCRLRGILRNNGIRGGTVSK